MIRSAVVRCLLCAAAVLGLQGVSLATQAAAPQAPPPRPAAIPRPTLAEAQQMLAASQAAAAKMGVALTCAVVDGRGDLVALARMDGVAFLTADVARGKAIASALLGQPSGNLAQLAPILQSVAGIARLDLLPLQGALPAVRSGQTLGAIGCSGGTGQQDEDAARVGAQTFH